MFQPEGDARVAHANDSPRSLKLRPSTCRVRHLAELRVELDSNILGGQLDRTSPKASPTNIVQYQTKGSTHG